ncbi:uncharacterized protein LOC141695408 [Apium graveolens]|uniref:uncharacterized protein LOC141695408 n=1 Tax=Apium graveolens TaxID=4045 RepID=UPI003D7A349D
MAWALRDLKRKFEGSMEVGVTTTPFIRKMESSPRESGLKHFNFDFSNGLADPEEHLNYFEQISNIYDYNDLTRCRFFASTLKGGAQKWFSPIPSRSVDSWKDFREIFLKRFWANRMNKLQMCHLETIQQRSKESLPEFIKRFQEAIKHLSNLEEKKAVNILKRFWANRVNELQMCHLEIIQQRSKESLPEFIKRFQEAVNQLSNLEEKDVVNIFRRNLHPVSCERYVKDLIHREPQSLASVYALASKFIKENDFLKSMKMNRRIHDDEKSPERRSPYRKDKRFKLDQQSNYIQQSQGTQPQDSYSGPQKNERKPRAKREPKPKPEWTPLNRPRADILREVKGKPFYYPPKPLLAPPENRARDKHCGYHEDHGHITENRFSLKMFIEIKLRRGT